MLENMTLARPYAQAIFDFAIENKSLEHWKNMLELFSKVSLKKEIQFFFSDIYSPSVLSKIFIIACYEKINIYGQNLINILAKNKKIKILKNILICFMKLYNNHKNIMKIVLTSAIYINDIQKKKICKILTKKFNKKINLKLKRDKNIIDGIILDLGDKIINDCFQNRFQELYNILLS